MVAASCVCASQASTGKDAMRECVDSLMADMSIKEKIWQINLSSGNLAAAVLTAGEGILGEISRGAIGATGGMSCEAAKAVQEASVTVANTGAQEGEEVVQLYISDPVAKISRPVKELKGIRKISLAPGESQTVTFSITPELLMYYDDCGRYSWDSGEFKIMIGSSSERVLEATCHWQK